MKTNPQVAPTGALSTHTDKDAPEKTVAAFRAGDTVRHIPSGECWIVGAVQFNELLPCGWPMAFAKMSDCALLKSCTEQEHVEMVTMWASKPQERRNGHDHRIAINRELWCSWPANTSTGGAQ